MVPCLALPMVPFDAGHEEDVGKRQAGHRGGHPKGRGVGGFVDVYPVPALFDLQSSTPRAQSEHWQKQQYVLGGSFSDSEPFTFWAG